MQPTEALNIAAQVAVTLTGFAGIVVVFRPESVHQWSRVDRFRLRLLLNNSIFPLAYALFAIFLLTINAPSQSIWRWCSAFAACFQVPFAIMNFTTARGFTSDEFKGISRIVFFPLFSIGISTLLLQFANIIWWNWFWPFFAGIFIHLMAGLLQFMRLILLPPQKTVP